MDDKLLNGRQKSGKPKASAPTATTKRLEAVSKDQRKNGHHKAKNQLNLDSSRTIGLSWDLKEVVKILLGTEAGSEAVERLTNGKIAISRQKDDATFHKRIIDNGQLVDKAKVTSMDGFGNATIIYISDKMSNNHAAAMIVHESTHSVQKAPNGIHFEWDNQINEPKSPANTLDIQFEMEKEAHVNQFSFELERYAISDKNELSDKCKECLTDACKQDESLPKEIDEDKVDAMIRRLYQVNAPQPGSLEYDAMKETGRRQNQALAFYTSVDTNSGPGNTKETYKADHIKSIVDKIKPFIKSYSRT